MTQEDIIKLASGFQGGGREFSQETATIVEAILDEVNTVDSKVEALPTPVQSDWTSTDTDSLAYIKNKPAPVVVTPTTVDTALVITATEAASALAALAAGVPAHVVSSTKKYIVTGFDSEASEFYCVDSTGTAVTIGTAVEEPAEAEVVETEGE